MKSLLALCQKNWLTMSIIILLAFIVRSFLFIFFLSKDGRWQESADSRQYQAVATSLLHSKTLTNADGSAQFYRLPGYPALLACWYFFCGDTPHYFLWFQVLLSLLIPLLTFVLAYRLIRSYEVALLAFSVIAFHVGFTFYAAQIMTETFFCIIFLLGLIFFYRKSVSIFSHTTASQPTSYKDMLIAGILFGLASLIRPVGVPILVACFSVICFMQGARKKKLGIFLTLVMGWISIVFGWLLRNYMLTGGIFFHTLPGVHFLSYSTSYVLAEAEQTSYAQAKSKLLTIWNEQVKKREAQQGRLLNEYERCKIAEHITAGYVKRYPFLMIKHALGNIVKTIIGLNTSHMLYLDSFTMPTYETTFGLQERVKAYLFPKLKYRFLSIFIYWDALMLLLMLGGIMAALFFAIRRKIYWDFYVKMLPFIVIFIGISLGCGGGRFRLPIEPLLIIIALLGVRDVGSAIKKYCLR